MPLLPLLIASTTLLPGLWEYTSSLAGMSGKTETKCLSKTEVERFLTDPSNRHYDCDYTTREVGGGKVRLQGVCTSRKHATQKIGVTLAGSYTPETISLKGTASARVIGNLELPVAASVSARRLGAACSAPPPTSPPTAADPAANSSATAAPGG